MHIKSALSYSLNKTSHDLNKGGVGCIIIVLDFIGVADALSTDAFSSVHRVVGSHHTVGLLSPCSFLV